MAIYRYECQCGYQHDQYLKADKDSMLLKCEGCGRMNNARQIRDRSIKTIENNNVVGLLRHEGTS